MFRRRTLRLSPTRHELAPHAARPTRTDPILLPSTILAYLPPYFVASIYLLLFLSLAHSFSQREIPNSFGIMPIRTLFFTTGVGYPLLQFLSTQQLPHSSKRTARIFSPSLPHYFVTFPASDSLFTRRFS